MITPELHRQAVPLDSRKHGQSVLTWPVEDWTPAARLNALFVTAAECAQAASDYPIVFIKAGQDAQGAAEYAPIAVFGMTAGENLYLDGTRWRATHLPAVMALYPFCVARLDDNRYAVCLDEAATRSGEGATGERLFGDDGQPTAFTRTMQGHLERLESQIEQTRVVSRRIAALDLLVERRFDATLPDGRKIKLDGFLTVDDERLKALPDATVLELHRDGVLAVIHAHGVSLGHMRRLLQWRIEREAIQTKG